MCDATDATGCVEGMADVEDMSRGCHPGASALS